MDAGSLRALIADQSGGIVPGATVTLTNAATGVAQDLVSDSEGYVAFSPIQRGNYSLRVELNGFRTREIKDITVDVNERKFLRVALDTAGVSETVEVTASVRTLQTEEGSLGQVIRGDIATQLPLAGRRYTELALLVPGATPSSMTLDTRGPGWFLVNGNTQTQNNFMLDGFDNNNGTQNAQSLSSQVVQPNPDAIDQFKVQTNSFSAEFGRSAGAVVNVSIKSGTNRAEGLGVVLQPRRVARVDFLERGAQQPAEGRPLLEPGRRHVRRTDHQEQALLLRLVRRLRALVLAVRPGVGTRRHHPHRRVPDGDHRPADRPAVPEQHHPAESLGSARVEDPRRLVDAEPRRHHVVNRHQHQQLRLPGAGHREHAQARPSE